MLRAALILLTSAACVHAASMTNSAIWDIFAWPHTTERQERAAWNDLYQKGSYSDLMTQLDSYRASHPQDAEALHLSGLLHWQAGNREESTRRLIQAFRAPGAQRVSAWALAAISATARSQAECVGWIRQAGRDQPPEEVARWLQMPYFSGFCDYPPYRSALELWGLTKLCPAAVPLSVSIPRSRVPAAPDLSDLLEDRGPEGRLRLDRETSSSILGITLETDPETESRRP